MLAFPPRLLPRCARVSVALVTVCVCVCVCARARACVCACVWVCTRVANGSLSPWLSLSLCFCRPVCLLMSLPVSDSLFDSRWAAMLLSSSSPLPLHLPLYLSLFPFLPPSPPLSLTDSHATLTLAGAAGGSRGGRGAPAPVAGAILDPTPPPPPPCTPMCMLEGMSGGEGVMPLCGDGVRPLSANTCAFIHR